MTVAKQEKPVDLESIIASWDQEETGRFMSVVAMLLEMADRMVSQEHRAEEALLQMAAVNLMSDMVGFPSSMIEPYMSDHETDADQNDEDQTTQGEHSEDVSLSSSFSTPSPFVWMSAIFSTPTSPSDWMSAI